MKEIELIKDIQDILFDTLCYFDDFCCEHGIKYYLSNGTLLGAAKYKGFIPWDDDVDVIVPRKDYDRLMQLAEINQNGYRLLCREQVPVWKMPYAKLSNEHTIIQEGEYHFGTEFGLAIDIFPIDRWSSCLLLARLQALRGEILKRLLVCSIGDAFVSAKRGLKRFILKSIWFVGKGMGHARVLKMILRSVEKSKKRKKKYAGCLSWTCHLDKEVFPARYFEETTYLSFCGRTFPTMVEYEAYLSSLYGNWRAELPLEQQRSNHSIKVWWKDAE